MQDIPPPPDPSDDALQSAMPALRKTSITGWAVIVGIAVVTISAMILIGSAAENRTEWLIGLPVAGIFAIFYAASWVRKRHESDVMPILAQAFGLRYVKSPVTYFNMLPANFVPRGGLQHCDDLMSGTIAERQYQFLEIKTETGGKNSRTLFDGVVVEVATRRSLPGFLIAPVAETQGFWIFKGRVGVDEKALMFTTPGPNGQDYGLWMDAGEQVNSAVLRPFMDRMLTLGTTIADGSLYSVACMNKTIFVSIRHKLELFQIGGLLASEADIMQDVRHASSQFAMPLRLATDVMRAEDSLIAAMDKVAQPH